MSMNLVLEAERTVYTKSGRECVQLQKVEQLWQTPDKLTHEVVALPTFEEQLDAYCKWADGVEAAKAELKGDVEDDLWQWEEVYDYGAGPREKYFILDNPHWSDRSAQQYVVKVVMKEDPEFEEIHFQLKNEFSFIYESEEEGFISVGYRKVKNLPHSQQIRKRVEMLKADEYELSFSMI
jgi:hypothetical protein